MTADPPLFEDFATYIQRESEKQRRGWSFRSQSPREIIEVRRFAGPAIYGEKLSHLRIAHLTDLHVGRVTPMDVQRAAVELTNAHEPDLVVITGDFVCHSQKYLDELESLMKGFRAPVVGVLGNHDHWCGATEVRRALRRAGVELLDNCNTVRTLHGQALQLVGLDDAYTSHADRERAVRGMRTDVPTLGLSHIAEEADRLWPHGIPLVLSGHTHGGQITLARLHEIAIGKLAGHKYVHGLYGTRRRDVAPHGAVYVGAGIGAAVIPFRLGDRGRREIALFELGMPPGTVREHHEEQAPLAGRKPSEKQLERRRAAVLRKEANRAKRAGVRASADAPVSPQPAGDAVEPQPAEREPGPGDAG